jgi:hypothetical protein
MWLDKWEQNSMAKKGEKCSKTWERRKPLDITGEKFGEWTVIKRIGLKSHTTYWLCSCSCGNKKEVQLGTLRNGFSKSCGHKHRTGVSKERLYSIWGGIKSRCNNTNQFVYKYYGARGIKCIWVSYEEFKEDVYNSYMEHVNEFGEKDTTIDRIDVNGHYSKENFRWATMREQVLNRNPYKIVNKKNMGGKFKNYLYEGEILNINQLSEKFGIKQWAMYSRIRNGKYTPVYI